MLGDRFRGAALTELLEATGPEALARARGRAAGRAPDPRSRGSRRFHHQLIRDVAYASLTRTERVACTSAPRPDLRARAGGRTPSWPR